MTQEDNRTPQTSRAAQPRERFLRNAGVAGAATMLGLATLAANPLQIGAARAQAAAAGLTDLDILNFALSLEHLEREFYSEALATGKLAGLAQAVVNEIYNHEIAHVVVLTAAITLAGGMPVQKQAKYHFGDMSSSAAILATAEVLERTGVGAYTGAAPLLKNKNAVLALAASIEQVEARHYAAIRFLRNELPAPAAFGPSLTVAQVQAATKPIFG